MNRSTDLSPPTTVLRGSRSVTILFANRGLLLPPYGEHPEVALDLERLELLEALSLDGGLPQAHRPLTPGQTDMLAELATRDLVREGGPADDRPPPAYDDGPVGWVTTAPAADPAASYELLMPLLLGCGSHGFEYVDHEGRSGIRLTAIEVMALAAFRTTATTVDAYASLDPVCGDRGLDQPAFERLTARLVAVGLLRPFAPHVAPNGASGSQTVQMREAMRRQAAVHDAFDRIDRAREQAWAGGPRVKVIGYHSSWSGPPASLGAVLAAAKGYQDGVLEQDYDFRARLCWDLPRLLAMATSGPGIYLFSNYIWNTVENLAVTQVLKQQDPAHVTVHGGPNTPKYGGDVEAWFAEHPYVDIAVHGEGEVTICELLVALRAAPGRLGDLSALAEVPGLSFRDGDRIVRTGPRDRVADINALPSAILSGVFEGFEPAGGDQAAGLTLETNRGCPYGCTFCDWGSATNSRIRKFDLDRIFAELEWCATRGFKISIADANFGIFERDVEIATEIARLKRAHGHPGSVGQNYAKNTVKHLSKIIEIFTDAGIVAEGKMSLQTFDEGTLTTIRRKNIKLEQYDNMSLEFRRNELPMSVDIMMGLPGATLDTMRDDLQECIDRDVRTYLYPTLLLPNSPMNDPDYRRENGIVASPGDTVRETTSYSRGEWDRMDRLRAGFWVFENFGVLRQIGTYARAETGRREIDVYEQLVTAAVADPDRWPTVAMTCWVMHELMTPPVSWKRLRDEVHRFLVTEIGLPDDSALATVLAVQHALQPAWDRTFPVTLDLPHDYATWHRDVTAARDGGHVHDWTDHIAPLRTYGPATFTVDDPMGYSQNYLGKVFQDGDTWDLDSPVARTARIAV